MKLTKKKALEECEKLWRWLEKNPHIFDKGLWLGWKEYEEKFGLIGSHCPCCQYAVEGDLNKSPNCKICPLKNIWPKNTPYGDPCMWPDSPFKRWYDTSITETRRENAKIIADECTKLLAK